MDNLFNTSNRGLAAALIMNDYTIVGIELNDKGKPSVNFTKDERLMEIFRLWRDRKLVGDLAAFNDALFQVHTTLKPLSIAAAKA